MAKTKMKRIGIGVGIAASVFAVGACWYGLYRAACYLTSPAKHVEQPVMAAAPTNPPMVAVTNTPAVQPVPVAGKPITDEQAFYLNMATWLQNTNAEVRAEAWRRLAINWEKSTRLLVDWGFTNNNQEVVRSVGRKIWDIAGANALPVMLEYRYKSPLATVSVNATSWCDEYCPGAILDRIDRARVEVRQVTIISNVPAKTATNAPVAQPPAVRPTVKQEPRPVRSCVVVTRPRPTRDELRDAVERESLLRDQIQDIKNEIQMKTNNSISFNKLLSETGWQADARATFRGNVQRWGDEISDLRRTQAEKEQELREASSEVSRIRWAMSTPN